MCVFYGCLLSFQIVRVLRSLPTTSIQLLSTNTMTGHVSRWPRKLSSPWDSRGPIDDARIVSQCVYFLIQYHVNVCMTEKLTHNGIARVWLGLTNWPSLHGSYWPRSQAPPESDGKLGAGPGNDATEIIFHVFWVFSSVSTDDCRVINLRQGSGVGRGTTVGGLELASPGISKSSCVHAKWFEQLNMHYEKF